MQKASSQHRTDLECVVGLNYYYQDLADKKEMFSLRDVLSMGKKIGLMRHLCDSNTRSRRNWLTFR